jgi:hypothetical protein
MCSRCRRDLRALPLVQVIALRADPHGCARAQAAVDREVDDRMLCQDLDDPATERLRD